MSIVTRKRTNPEFLNGVPELLVLAFLSRRPMHGYDRITTSIGIEEGIERRNGYVKRFRLVIRREGNIMINELTPGPGIGTHAAHIIGQGILHEQGVADKTGIGAVGAGRS